jgi:hypothetical protein
VSKIKDGGGAPGEAPVALAIALRTRALLQRDGYRVAMTRTGPTYAGGNIARAHFCNVRHAALMIRIHADGSTDSSQHGVKTLVPALHRGWTDDIYARSLRAGRAVQSSVVRATGAKNVGDPVPLGPDRLQLGRRACDPRRDRFHDEPGGGTALALAPLPAQGRARARGRRTGVPPVELAAIGAGAEQHDLVLLD